MELTSLVFQHSLYSILYNKCSRFMLKSGFRTKTLFSNYFFCVLKLKSIFFLGDAFDVHEVFFCRHFSIQSVHHSTGRTGNSTILQQPSSATEKNLTSHRSFSSHCVNLFLPLSQNLCALLLLAYLTFNPFQYIDDISHHTDVFSFSSIELTISTHHTIPNDYFYFISFLARQ